MVYVSFFNPSRKILGQYFKVVRDHFQISLNISFTVSLPSQTQCYITAVAVAHRKISE